MAKAGPNNKVQYEEFVTAVAKGQSLAYAARAIGVAPRTGSRWAARPDFKGRVEGVRTELINAVAGGLAALAMPAAAALGKLLKEGPPAVQLGAARAVIGSLIEVRSHLELSQRIDALEKRLGEGGKP